MIFSGLDRATAWSSPAVDPPLGLTEEPYEKYKID